MHEHMHGQDCVRPGRIRDEQDGAGSVGWALAGICALGLAFVLSVVWWSPK